MKGMDTLRFTDNPSKALLPGTELFQLLLPEPEPRAPTEKVGKEFKGNTVSSQVQPNISAL